MRCARAQEAGDHRPDETGAQPMSYASGRYWITYNGELYNYRELRRELEAAGLGFGTNTNAEVLTTQPPRRPG